MRFFPVETGSPVFTQIIIGVVIRPVGRHFLNRVIIVVFWHPHPSPLSLSVSESQQRAKDSRLTELDGN